MNEQRNNIWVVPIEPIDQRYTKQWFDEIPKLLEKENYEIQKFVIHNIEGDPVEETRTSGAFLDFAKTNAYKSSQLIKIAKLFNDGVILPKDKFLFTDSWNPAILQVKYMSDLLDVPVEIHGIWHAGNYDPTDILGMKMKGDWPHYLELALYEAIDFNYFATHFHRNTFITSLKISTSEKSKKKLCISGQPHDEIIRHISYIPKVDKEDIVVWPHRYNDDKNPHIIEWLAPKLEALGIRTVITQKLNLSKDEYYKLLAKSKMVFSCASHENLGISMMEGVLSDCIPLVPDSSSYHEMYFDIFKYDPNLNYTLDLKPMIVDMIRNYDKYKYFLDKQKKILFDHYLNANPMINNIIWRT